MNRLSLEKLVPIMTGLVEGQSIRSLERMTGVHRDTIMRWQVRVGEEAFRLSESQIKGLTVRYVQADELWSFIGMKDNVFQYHWDVTNGYKGEAWVGIAMDAETKLVISYILGPRNGKLCHDLMADVRKKIAGPFQFTSDGFRSYAEEAPKVFGSDVSVGQLIKVYSGETVIAAKPTIVSGNPDMDEISTSYIERQNLSLRMGNRRLTRKTNAFSKKAAHHLTALHLYFAYYNFCRTHRSLKMPPALAAGATNHVWSMREFVQPAWEKFYGVKAPENWQAN